MWSLTLSNDSITEVNSEPYDIQDVYMIGDDVFISYIGDILEYTECN